MKRVDACWKPMPIANPLSPCTPLSAISQITNPLFVNLLLENPRIHSSY